MIKKVKKTALGNKKTKTEEAVLKSNTIKSKFYIPFFPEGTSREDKISFFSFCLGLIVMACFFIIDLQIRNYLQIREWEDKMRAVYRTQAAIQAGIVQVKPTRSYQTIKKTPQASVQCPPVWQRKAQFEPDEYKPYDAVGALKISGNFCADLPKGVACPDHITVFVNPQTSYSNEWWVKHWAGTYGLSKVDERAIKYNKHATVSKDGAFTIGDLPAGTYYVGGSACVKEKNKKGCRNVRLGAVVKLEKDQIIKMQQVFPKK